MAKMSETEVPFLTLNEMPDDGTGIANPNADYRRLFVGEDGDLHLKDSAGAVTDIGGGGGGAATAQTAKASADVSIGTANTWTDITGMSLSLLAGTYVIWASVHWVTGTALFGGTRIWDGTTSHASAEDKPDAAEWGTMALGPVTVVVASTTTFKVQCISDTAGNNFIVKAALGANGVGNNACCLTALKIA